MILQRKIAGLSADTLGRFALRARRAAGLEGAVNILVTTSQEMRSLNARFRQHDKATDVLSFPPDSASNGRSRRKGFAGDVAISAEIAGEYASRLGHSTAVEIKILTLHGILHLAGFDHERDNGKMARIEAKLRRVLRLPSSLIARTSGREIGTPRRGSALAPRTKGLP